MSRPTCRSSASEPCSEYGVLIFGARNWMFDAETLPPVGAVVSVFGNVGTGGELRRLRGRERDLLLQDAVVREQVVDHRPEEAGVEHAVAGANDRLIVQAVRQTNARLEVLRAGRNVASLRIILVALPGLRQSRTLVTKAQFTVSRSLAPTDPARRSRNR